MCTAPCLPAHWAHPCRGNILPLAVAPQSHHPATPALLAAQALLFSVPAPRLVPAGLWVPEAPVLAVVSCWLPLTAVCGHLCSHGDGLCLGEHHGVAVEGH